jgi:aromatic-L-amino-acid decarboxylase
MITDDGKIYMVPGKVNDLYFMRFAICAATTEELHIDYAWNIIIKYADIIISKQDSLSSDI